MKDRVLVGLIGRRHGSSGGFYVNFYEDFPIGSTKLYVSSSPEVLKDNGMENIEIERADESSGRWLVSFGTERDDLTGLFLFADRWKRGKDIFWKKDLVGCEACGPDGSRLGRVTGLEDSVPQIWVTIETPQGGRFSFPFLKEFVRNISVKERKITVDVPDGVGVYE